MRALSEHWRVSAIRATWALGPNPGVVVSWRAALHFIWTGVEESWGRLGEIGEGFAVG